MALVSGSQPARTRRSALEAIASGEVRLIVGTHALFQEGIDFAQLALIIVDEQHRFGVQQRLRLQEKGRKQGRFPHQLIMTATPIPRTLAMTAYADLDISVIDELPPGRTPVKTVVVPEQRRDEVVARILAACREGRQVYWVCPLIEESDELRYQAAEETAAALAEALPEVRVGLVHGRMPPAKKDQAMLAFKAGKIQLLVATTVIEVGVDVPNATLMVIENAERMGLAQLHQLRGRVGRGAEASTCVLLYRSPLSELARERLKVIRETNDGFEIARRDLELRGPGELLGTRQTGLAQLRVADLMRDADLLPRVQEAAELMLGALSRITSRRSPRAGSAPASATDEWVSRTLSMATAQLDLGLAPKTCGSAVRSPAGAARRGVRAPHAARPAHRHLAADVADAVGAVDRGRRPADAADAHHLPARHGRDALGRLRHQRFRGSQRRSAREAHARPAARRAAHRAGRGAGAVRGVRRRRAVARHCSSMRSRSGSRSSARRWPCRIRSSSGSFRCRSSIWGWRSAGRCPWRSWRRRAACRASAGCCS